MTQSSPSLQPARFSTQWLPERDRLAIWREEFSRRLVRLEIEPIEGEPLHYDTTYQPLGEVTVAVGNVSAISCARTPRTLQDGNGDIVLLIPETTEITVEQGRIEDTLSPGDCLIRRSSEVGQTWSRAGQFLTLSLPVGRLSERVAKIDRLGMSVLRADNEAVRYLVSYCRSILKGHKAIPPDIAQVIGTHLLDLASLAVGANSDAWLTAQDRGLRAVRLHTARSIIKTNAATPGYRIRDLAGKLKVSESYLRKLFAEQGDTFSSLLLEARLNLARNMLADARLDDMKISQIVFACGFGDVSYFNRTFNRHYEMTPSEARTLARKKRLNS